eukprot:CAMPEP_0168486646 /NCGR_PEP_ID=MMETSP0228-20121227/67228_1 /TAXON_ID=133427 /ORGANISM="Protoceratium reticulatum, Strain CCCM 535 (=CCMP 1889)" /LENGTH=263 /DNA_ID=CAMNT_0008503239 /DNA_START=256 /DNA_END=1043 /DNA_ORIENTATION=+
MPRARDPLSLVATPVLPGEGTLSMFPVLLVLANVLAPVRPCHNARAMELPMCELAPVLATVVPVERGIPMLEAVQKIARPCGVPHLGRAGALAPGAEGRWGPTSRLRGRSAARAWLSPGPLGALAPSGGARLSAGAAAPHGRERVGRGPRCAGAARQLHLLLVAAPAEHAQAGGDALGLERALCLILGDSCQTGPDAVARARCTVARARGAGSSHGAESPAAHSGGLRNSSRALAPLAAPQCGSSSISCRPAAKPFRRPTTGG